MAERRLCRVALSFLYLMFIRVLQLIRLLWSDRDELAAEVVVLRREVAVLRQVDRRGCGLRTGPSWRP